MHASVISAPSVVRPCARTVAATIRDGFAHVRREHFRMRGFIFPALANTPVPENKKLRLCGSAIGEDA